MDPSQSDDYPTRFTFAGEPVHLDRLVFSRKLRELAERTAGGGGGARGDRERAERVFQRENGIAVGEVVMPWRLLLRPQAAREAFEGAAPLGRDFGAECLTDVMDHGSNYFQADGGAHVRVEDPEDRKRSWVEWRGSEPACFVSHPFCNPFIGRRWRGPGPEEISREMGLKAIFVDFPSWYVAGESAVFVVVHPEVEIEIE